MRADVPGLNKRARNSRRALRDLNPLAVDNLNSRNLRVTHRLPLHNLSKRRIIHQSCIHVAGLQHDPPEPTNRLLGAAFDEPMEASSKLMRLHFVQMKSCRGEATSAERLLRPGDYAAGGRTSRGYPCHHPIETGTLAAIFERIAPPRPEDRRAFAKASCN